MKYAVFLFMFLCFSSSNASAQVVGGDVVVEGRDVVPETSFILEGANNGWAVIELAVDRKGNITSAQIKETNMKSSLDKIQLRKHAMKIKFVAGTHFPKFHNAEVRITMIKTDKAQQEFELEID